MNDFRVKSQESRLGKNRTAKDNSGASDAALRGAALAFGNGKPPVRPKPLVHNPPRTNGALAAATLAEHEGAGSRRPRSNLRTSEDVGLDQRLAYQNTGSSVGSRTSRADLHRRNSTQLQMARSNYLQPPGGPALDQSRSASFIAATLAASRSASISPNATGPAQFQTSPQGRFGVSKTPSVRSIKSTDSGGKGSDPLDTRSIPPTTSLIGMFEQNAASPQTVKWPGTNKTGTTNAIRSSRPGEASSLSPRGHTPSPSSETPRKPAVALPKPAPPTMALHAPEAPGTSKTTKPPILAKKPSIAVASKPVPIPSKSPASDPRQKDASSDDSFVSASDIQQMSPRPSSEYKPSFRAELNSQKANRLRSPSQISIASEQMKIESMANAIVASSLASSRATSASPSTNSLHGPNQHQPSVPPSHRNVHSRHHLFHNSRENSRASSPAKAQGMRMTMRKDRQEETDEGEKRRGKKNLVKKHPNKHHEGDRKRWRDVITERERKRYEAVWASNRGLYTSYPLQGRKTSGTEDMEVCNLVVRDIWSRSKIHDDVLEEVYELVDRSSSGSLDKVEFVVGMWLVDQWLKGRKLPVRVGDSVWKSVGALNGLKVKIWA